MLAGILSSLCNTLFCLLKNNAVTNRKFHNVVYGIQMFLLTKFLMFVLDCSISLILLHQLVQSRSRILALLSFHLFM